MYITKERTDGNDNKTSGLPLNEASKQVMSWETKSKNKKYR